MYAIAKIIVSIYEHKSHRQLINIHMITQLVSSPSAVKQPQGIPIEEVDGSMQGRHNPIA